MLLVSSPVQSNPLAQSINSKNAIGRIFVFLNACVSVVENPNQLPDMVTIEKSAIH
jgi:hypothetical protein